MPIALGSDLGQDSVQIKLSDYGISQFAATQGARGLVGTPGFIAPEILKYQGKEVSCCYCGTSLAWGNPTIFTY